MFEIAGKGLTCIAQQSTVTLVVSDLMYFYRLSHKFIGCSLVTGKYFVIVFIQIDSWDVDLYQCSSLALFFMIYFIDLPRLSDLSEVI